MTTGEWIELKATLHAIDHREFICSECLDKYQGRQDAEMMTSKMRELKGCEIEKPAPVHNIGKEIYFSNCIGNYFSHGSVSLLEVHKQYENGVMPYAGALTDQPAKVIEIMSVISNHKNEQAIERQKQEALRAKRRGR